MSFLPRSIWVKRFKWASVKVSRIKSDDGRAAAVLTVSRLAFPFTEPKGAVQRPQDSLSYSLVSVSSLPDSMHLRCVSSRINLVVTT
jgi:hypothetical protein